MEAYKTRVCILLVKFYVRNMEYNYMFEETCL